MRRPLLALAIAAPLACAQVSPRPADRPPRAVASASAPLPSSSTPLPSPSATAPEAPADPPPHACGIEPDGDEVDRAILDRPTQLKKGIGVVTQKVTTSSSEAQAFYDQGLAYLHSYVWIEAARSFNDALRRDPKMAMAWVGVARAELGLGQKKHARDAIARAVSLREGASDREKLYIDLRAQQIEGQLSPLVADQQAMHAKYKVALDKAIALDPSDVEMWILRGNAEEESIAGRGQRGEVGSIAYYEAALRRAPDHFGAHHYLVHSYENVRRPHEAVAHGRSYAAAAPNVAHAQHMLGHVLPKIGNWPDALEQFKKADRIEEAYALAEKLRPGDDWHHAHNLDLLGYSFLRLGRFDDAEKTFRRRWAVPVRLALVAGWNIALPGFLLLRGRFDEALKIAGELASSPTPAARIAGFALSAEALVALGRVDEAKVAARRATSLLADETRPKTANARVFGVFYGTPVHLAEALVALRGPDAPDGEKKLLEVTDAYASSPHVDAIGNLFVLERTASLLRRAGRADLAAKVADKMARIDPDYRPRE